MINIIKQNELELANIDFQIRPNERGKIPLFSIVLQNLQLLVSLELTSQMLQ